MASGQPGPFVERKPGRCGVKKVAPSATAPATLDPPVSGGEAAQLSDDGRLQKAG